MALRYAIGGLALLGAAAVMAAVVGDAGLLVFVGFGVATSTFIAWRWPHDALPFAAWLLVLAGLVSTTAGTWLAACAAALPGLGPAPAVGAVVGPAAISTILLATAIIARRFVVLRPSAARWARRAAIASVALGFGGLAMGARHADEPAIDDPAALLAGLPVVAEGLRCGFEDRDVPLGGAWATLGRTPHDHRATTRATSGCTMKLPEGTFDFPRRADITVRRFDAIGAWLVSSGERHVAVEAPTGRRISLEPSSLRGRLTIPPSWYGASLVGFLLAVLALLFGARAHGRLDRVLEGERAHLDEEGMLTFERAGGGRATRAMAAGTVLAWPAETRPLALGYRDYAGPDSYEVSLGTKPELVKLATEDAVAAALVPLVTSAFGWVPLVAAHLCGLF